MSQKKQLNFFVYQLTGGGTEKICVTLANKFANAGYLVRIFTYKNYHSNDANLSDDVEVVELNLKSSRASFYKLFKAIKKYKIKNVVVFNQQIAAALIFMCFLKIIDIKIVTRVSNNLSAVRHSYSLWNKYISYYFLKCILKKSNYLVCQSTGILKDLTTSFKVDKKKCHVIFNPAIISKRNKASETKPDNIMLPYILYAGRLVRQKQVEHIIYAYNKLGDTGCKLVIAGSGPERKFLEDLVCRLNIENKVFFVGFQNDLALYYENASLTVLASKHEGFPNVLVESLCCGTPIIAYDCPSGPSDIIINGINGELVEPNNIEDLTNKISAGLNRSWIRDDIIKTADNFSEELFFNKYKSLFDEFLL